MPDTQPILTDDRKRSVFEADIEHPEKKGFFRQCIDMVHRMEEIARGVTFFGRHIRVEPYLPVGTDGPLTVAMNLRGLGILTDLVEDPAYAASFRAGRRKA